MLTRPRGPARQGVCPPQGQFDLLDRCRGLQVHGLLMVADVVDFQAARRRREEQSLERHFGLPEGAAWINPDFWDQRHMPSRPGRDAGSIAGDLYAFAKTGGPTLLDNSLEAAANDNLTE